MSFTALVLANGASTPVNKTFTPIASKDNFRSWMDTTSGIAVGMPEIQLQNRTPNGADHYKVVARVKVPVLEQVAGDSNGYQAAPKVAYVITGVMDLTLPTRSSLDVRKDARAFMANLLDSVEFKKAVDEFVLPFN